MKIKRLSAMICFMTAAAAAVALGTGCADHRTDLTVRTAGSDGFRISRTWVSREDGRTLVSGRITGGHYNFFFGHVDVAVLGPDGEVVFQGSTRVVGKGLRRGLHPVYVFRVELPGPPPGSTVRLALHGDAGTGSACDDNRTLTPD